MTEPAYDRRRYSRVETDARVTIVFVVRRQLERREVTMLNVGLGGCLLKGTLVLGERVAVLVHRGFFVVGRVMAGPEPDTARIEWSPDDADAAELIAHFRLPEAT